MVNSEPGDPTNDSHLLAAVQRGQQQAFGEIFDRHVPAVFWQAFKHVHDADAAQDIVQDAFYLLWQKRDTVRIVDESVLPWLMVTAHNLARNAHRKTQRQAALTLVDDITADGTAEPDAVVEAEIVSAHIETAISKLSELDRQIFDLCIDQELSYEQAASQLGITHDTVRNRLSRLKQRLRGDLAHVREES